MTLTSSSTAVTRPSGQAASRATAIRLQHIEKYFGETHALRDVNLEIAAGELFFLLGPSGCGKSTLLRLIAGLHDADGGKILFNDRDVTSSSTESRNAVMCFQSYALWPHMTVRENVRFGLSVRKLPRDQQDRQIDQVLRLVQMQSLADRKPNQLSGGQQQRVALARALAVRPDCLLLDEPLSNLDAKLRLEMRGEIRRICKTSGFTTVYVTHDQKEALSVADRIALLQDGRIVQVGTPDELYHHPRTSFAADFIGATNLIRGQIVSREPGSLRVETPAGTIVAADNGENVQAGQTNAGVILSIRPEMIRVARAGAGGGNSTANRLIGISVENTFLGESSEHVLQVKQQRLKIVATPPLRNSPGELTVEFDPADVVVLSE